MADFTQKISRSIWEMKYRYERPDGSHEASVEETWERVAKAIAWPSSRVSAHTGSKPFTVSSADFIFCRAVAFWLARGRATLSPYLIVL